MLKLYKRAEDGLRYHEAWENDSIIYEHWGLVGERGDTREHHMPRGESAKEAILEVLHSATISGFQPAMEDHAVLLIEYPIDGMGNREDLENRHRLDRYRVLRLFTNIQRIRKCLTRRCNYFQSMSANLFRIFNSRP